MSGMDAAVMAIANHEFDSPDPALTALEALINRTCANAAARAELETALARLLDGKATRAAKQLACKKLWMMGTDASVPALGRLLSCGDVVLVEAACLAIALRKSEAASAALRGALARATGAALAAIVTLLGERQDAAAAVEIAPLTRSPDPVVADAAIAALGKIATPRAVSTLNALGGDAAAHALLRSAEELAKGGNRSGARAIYQKLKEDGMPSVIRRAAQAATVMVLCAIGMSAQNFKPLFNGKDLSAFDVDTASVWSVRDGVIIGKSPGLKYNEFLRTKKHYQDFVLEASFRLIGGKGNSGIQFRSKPVPDSHEVSGYQADAGQNYWGALYDESRRKKVLVGPPAEFLKKLDPAAWHKYVITAKGPHITLVLDGVETVNYEEKDPGIEQTGLIALQVHADKEPVEMQFKDLRIKVLK